ncbi:polyprenyl diphosphate synthase [Streptomyces sp. NBC_01433]|uniref:polyprenyl diphosphate synthase n=1 Tax=Streptomyces sp. NBC_01433 TaxID=2903864 RepID=UPI00225424CB|nr:polyprenyl diphosphate synthase [Streptomyces sp. NBC_01433]MCX4681486.1 polyprenyl diphosphate synthase [Streptomyces sp. NBC_01433]
MNPVQPQHVGIVLDGNRRWAKEHGLSASDGHRIGFGRIPEVLSWCEASQIPLVTLWMLSTENLRRDPAEVEALMEIITGAVLQLSWSGRWRVRHLGEADALPSRVAQAVRHAEQASASAPTALTVNLAIAYGGRVEITSAVRRLMAGWAREGIAADEAAKQLTVEDLCRAINGGQPDLDLLIRTSGERRSSGFLLWGGVGAELWFTPAYWPDFTRQHLTQALTHYREAHRR